jgi:integrase
LDQVEVQKAMGSWIDPNSGRVTFEEWFGIYMARTPKRPHTASRDRRTAKRWLFPRLGKVRVGDITPGMVRALVDEMAATLKPSSVRTHYGVLRAAMNAAVEADMIGRSPCRGIKLPPERPEQPRFLAMDELHRLAGEIPVEHRPMIYVAGVLGLRFSEVAGLRVGRIDFLRRTVSIVETVAEVEGELIFDDTKTKASRRSLRAPAEIMDILAEHLARRGRPGPDELVFVAPDGGPLRINHFRSRVFNPAKKRAGLDDVTFHGLRHSAVGFMIQLGAHARVIQQRMGHASIRTTFDIYGSVLPEVDMAVSDGLGDLLSENSDSRGLSAACGENGETPGEPETASTWGFDGGGERTRTAGLVVANDAL